MPWHPRRVKRLISFGGIFLLQAFYCLLSNSPAKPQTPKCENYGSLFLCLLRTNLTRENGPLMHPVARHPWHDGISHASSEALQPFPASSVNPWVGAYLWERPYLPPLEIQIDKNTGGNYVARMRNRGVEVMSRGKTECRGGEDVLVGYLETTGGREGREKRVEGRRKRERIEW
eukprot:359312-Amorphochlora_amoeboformis.AAC.1